MATAGDRIETQHMLYTCITTIAVKPGQVSEFLRDAEKDLLPRYRELPGFVAYTVAKMGDTSAIAFSLWQTHTQAEQSVKSSDEWMKDAIDKLIVSFHPHVGELPFLAFTGDLKVYASVAPVGGRQV